MPVDPNAALKDENGTLAYAPTNPREFAALAIQMGQILLPRGEGNRAKPDGNGQSAISTLIEHEHGQH
jgi:carbonic anhydrase